ncbi:hypothetical protein SAMCFNEI73_pA0038 (plasmid) [Sinorhizobium americanum]|uniref:Uncharacterized protein n=1 Tax=Sinorhizobium americanum TaxID=194963 RepID=A0A1L3LSF2_9HYPH|nr:hypothetical protein SAMCFNEI73_pA0038 [Sinorhizobium americanum]
MDLRLADLDEEQIVVLVFSAAPHNGASAQFVQSSLDEMSGTKAAAG